MDVRQLLSGDRAWASAQVSEHFASPQIVSRGVLHDTQILPGLIAELAGERLGLLHYALSGAQMEIIVLLNSSARRGVGRALLAGAAEIARRAECWRIWLVTTNNNHAAQRFYRALGWRQAAVHHAALDAARRLKPEIPAFDQEGREIRDEIEFELLLNPPTGSERAV